MNTAIETEWVSDTIAVTLLRDNDFLHELGQFVKEDPKVGTKWVHLTTRDGTVLKFEIGTEIEIQREQETKASYKARALVRLEAKFVKQIEWHEANDEANVLSALESASAQVTNQSRYGIGRQLDELINVAVQRIEADTWSWVIFQFRDEKSTTRGDAIASFKKVRDGFVKELSTRVSSYGPLSRSTSLASNLGEDLERHAKAKFVEDLRWTFDDED